MKTLESYLDEIPDTEEGRKRYKHLLENEIKRISTILRRLKALQNEMIEREEKRRANEEDVRHQRMP